jgi:hypothetical protein
MIVFQQRKQTKTTSLNCNVKKKIVATKKKKANEIITFKEFLVTDAAKLAYRTNVKPAFRQ